MPGWVRWHAETAVDDAVRRILVVDDDVAMRAALRRVFAHAGYAVELYGSGMELLAQADLHKPGCILLDLRMPEMDGLHVQRELLARQNVLPLIFLTGSAEIKNAVEAMRAGAVDFVEKPFDNDDLVARVNLALSAHLRERAEHADELALAERLQRLSPREGEVLSKLAQGLTNKEIARELGTSFRTVEIQRARIMEKMHADSLADLIRMVLQARRAG